MTRDEAFQMALQTAMKLGEHFDTPSVQILINYKDENGHYNFIRAATGNPQTVVGMLDDAINIHRTTVSAAQANSFRQQGQG
jgi:hypothetical protein